MNKTMNNCVHHDNRGGDHLNHCTLLRDEVRCVPEKCIWHTTERQRISSYLKAVEIWKKNHPDQNWDEQKGLVPKEFRTEVKRQIRLKEICGI